jgi:hypothetical protein
MVRRYTFCDNLEQINKLILMLGVDKFSLDVPDRHYWRKTANDPSEQLVCKRQLVK